MGNGIWAFPDGRRRYDTLRTHTTFWRERERDTGLSGGIFVGRVSLVGGSPTTTGALPHATPLATPQQLHRQSLRLPYRPHIFYPRTSESQTTSTPPTHSLTSHVSTLADRTHKPQKTRSMYHLEGTHSDPPSTHPTLLSTLYKNAVSRWQGRAAGAAAGTDAAAAQGQRGAGAKGEGVRPRVERTGTGGSVGEGK